MKHSLKLKLLTLRDLLFFIILCFISIEAIAQQTEIEGKVSDANGVPLPGVNVLVRSTTNGAVTDFDGNYSINALPDAILVFSYLGFETKEISVNNRLIINVQLQESASALDEVMIVGFGTQKKQSVTGSISTISTSEMKKVSTPSLSNALAGKLPGILSRQSSGEPGYDAASLYIRGFGTLGNNSPLILVDGVERDLNNISPEVIESFSILKDASATAVYGVRGANGVILIETKKGRIGPPEITFRTEFASQSNLRLPSYINGAQYAELMNEGLANVGKSSRWTPEEIEKFRSGSDPYLYPNVDWLDLILKNSSLQTINNLNVRGGGETVRYFVNVGYILQNGTYKDNSLNDYNTNANLNRYNFRSNIDIALSDKLDLSMGLAGIIDDRNYPGPGGQAAFDAARNTSPIAFPVRNPDGSLGGQPAYLGSNPFGVATESGYSRDIHNTLQGTFGLDYDLSSITEGFSVKATFAYDFFYFNKALRFKTFEVNQYLGKDDDGNDQYNLLREAQPLGYDISQNSNRALYTELQANYNRTFGKHGVSGLLLANRREYTDLTAGTSILNLPYRRQGIAGRATYDFDSRYLLEFNFGYNGSENFPKGKKYGFFPSISAGWIVSNEAFWDVEVINSLKFRFSHGEVGNDQVGGPRFLFLSTYDTNNNSQNYFYGPGMQSQPGVTEGQLGSANVTWEVAKKSNLGVDLEMFDGKLSLQADVFREDRSGILLQRQQVSGVAGYQSGSIPYGNLGRVLNKGLDALLEFSHTTPNDFYYSFRGNFTFARNEVIENDEAPPLYDYLSRKGVSATAQWGYVAEGLFHTDQEIADSPDQSPLGGIPTVGSIKYEDVNGDGRIDSYDVLPISYGRTPEIIFGFGGTAAFKSGFDLSLYFTGTARTNIFLEGRSMYPFQEGLGVFNVLEEYYNNRYTAANPNAKYPKVTDGNNPNDFRPSTLWMRDASYLRIRNAEIGYSFPKSLTENWHLSSTRLFINATNLYTWDKVDIIDPESNNGTGSYPVQRTINLGASITF